MLPDRQVQPQRCMLPSLAGDPPEVMEGPGFIKRERTDPRRMRTAYVLGLIEEVRRRMLDGTCPLGTEDVEQPRIQVERGSPDVLHDHLDIARHSDEDCIVEHDDGGKEQMTTATATPETKKASKAAKKKPAKAAKKSAPKKAKASKKAKVREQTCVNLYIPVKVALDKACKKSGKSRNRVLNELAAKFTGVKIGPARRAAV